MNDIVFGMEIELEGGEKVRGQFVSTAKAAEQLEDSVGKTGAKAKQAGNDIDKFGTETEKAGEKTKKTSGFLKGMFNEFFSLKGLIAGIGFGLITQQIIDVGNVTSGWAVGLEAVTGSAQIANEQLTHSRELAKRLGLDIRTTTDSFVQFSAATQGSALQGFKTTKVFDAVSTAMRVLNRSSDDTAGALKALEQMVSKGNVQAEELRGQLGERLPGAFRDSAEAMGVTTQQLNKMLEQGQVLASDLLPKLADVLQSKYGPGLTKAIEAPAQGFRNLSNAVFEFYEGLSGAVFDNLASGAQSLADALNAMTPVLSTFIDGLLTLLKIAAIGGGLYLGFLGLTAIIAKVGAVMAGLSFMHVQFAAGAIISAASNWTFNKSLTATIALTNATIASVGRLKLAFLSLFALFAGMEIGKWINDNFVQARVAGLAFVGAMETGFVNLGYAFDVAMVSIKSAWNATLNTMKDTMAAFYSGIGSVLSAVGLDSAASIYNNAAADWKAEADEVGTLSARIAELTTKRDADVKKIDDIITALVAQELGIKKVNKAVDDGQKTKLKDPIETVISENEKFIKSLEQKLALTKFFGKELAIQTALQELDTKATKEQIAAVRELAGSLYDQAEAAKGWDISSLIDQTNDFAGAWGNVGNTIVDAFGSAAEQLNRFAEQQDNYIKQLDEVAKARAAQATNPDLVAREKNLKDLYAYENKLREQNTRAQLGAFGSMLGAASKMFGEQSKGREALHRAEQVFTAVEIALSFQKAAANALTAITSQGQGDPYTAFARIAAMAALMAGLGVFAGGVSGSSSYTKPTSGTGTVLGSDESSESIANAFEDYEDIALDQLAELQKISGALTGITSGVAQLSALLVRSSSFGGAEVTGLGTEKFGNQSFIDFTHKLDAWTGGLVGVVDEILGGALSDIAGSIIGGISKTTKNLIDTGLQFDGQEIGDILADGFEGYYYNVIETTKRKLWGLSKKTKTSTELTGVEDSILNEIGAIFGYLAQAVDGAIDVLGVDTVKSLESFVVKLGSISFEGMSGDEIQDKLSAVISTQGDLLAEYVSPQIKEYQQIGEGALETLLRVAQAQAVFNDNLDRTGVILSGLSAIDLIDVSQNIIGLMGGLDAFKDASNTFFTEFFSEQEQFAYLQKSLSEVLATMNLSLPENRDGFKALVQGIDITTDAGQSLYATLLQVSGSAAEYYKQLESQTGVLQDNSKLLAERAEFENDIADALARMDFTGLQTALVDLNTWYTNQIEQAAALGADTTLLEQLYGRKRADVIADALTAINTKTESEMTSLTKTHESAVGALTADYQQLFDAIGAVSATITSSVLELQRAMTGWNEVAYQAAEVNRLRNELGTGDIASQTSAVEQLIAATMEKWRAELAINDAAISKTEQLISEHESAVADLQGTYDNLFSAIESVNNAGADSILALQRAMTGWNEVAYQAAEIDRLRAELGTGDIASQTSAVEQLIAATMEKWRAELAVNDAAISKTEQLISEHESAVAELDSTYNDLFSTINGVAGSISSSILAIRRSMSGWNEVGYQNTNISQLYGQIGSGSIAEQTNTVQGLIDAINARYQAELANNNELSNAANERYQAELSAYESLKNAAESLKKAADSLLLGDLSYLSQGDQLAEAKRQYEQALASGDVAGLERAGTDYLKIAQEYFSTGSNQYGDIFDQVNSAFRNVNAGSAPSAPNVAQYQNDNLALQQSTIDELSGLQLLLDDLNAQALAQQELEAAALQEQLTGFNTELLALQLNANDLAQGAINEINALQLVLSDLNAQAIALQSIDSANLQTQLAGLNTELLALQLAGNDLAQLAIDEISSLQLLLDDLNTQAIAQQTTDLTALQSTLDTDLVALLASSAEQINAVNNMSNNIVAAINAIDIAPVIIAPAAPTPTTNTTETKTNNNVADFSKDVTPKTQNNDDVVAAVKAVKDEMINMRRDLNKTNELVYSNRRLA